MAILYPSHYRELATRIGCVDAKIPLSQYISHFVPGCYAGGGSTPWHQVKVEACAWTRCSGRVRVVSISRVAFRVAGGLLLDHVYLKRPRFQWYVAWATGTAIHLYLGRVVADACASGNPLSNSL